MILDLLIAAVHVDHTLLTSYLTLSVAALPPITTPGSTIALIDRP